MRSRHHVDPLSDVLRTLRLAGSVLFQAEFHAPWRVSSPASCDLAPMLALEARQMVLFHVVVDGRCRVEVDGQERVLGAGDVVIFPHATPHVMGAGERATETPIAALLPPPPWDEPPSVQLGLGPDTTRILCGFLHCDDLGFNPLFARLPSLLVLEGGANGDGLLPVLLRQTLNESGSLRPGSRCMSDRLAEVMLVEALRAYMTESGAAQAGWLGAAQDPLVSRALSAIHDAPARAWNVQSLAREAGTSRSILAERFRAKLGIPPMQYVTRWRLALGAQRLRASDETVASVAASVGYASEAAFSRAFSRWMGRSPSEERKKPAPGT
jgi:AraC family transcriptional regulator, alkane utilization regulator